MNKEQRQLARWEKIKSKGMFSHIIKRGTICYGVVFFLIFVFIVPFIDYSYTFGFVYNETFIYKVIAFAIVAPLVGTLMGYIGWKGLEKKHRNL
jgi:hypothetical protein